MIDLSKPVKFYRKKKFKKNRDLIQLGWGGMVEEPIARERQNWF